MKKADISLIAILICVFVIFISIYFLTDNKDDSILIIQQDNEIVYRKPIDEDNIVNIYDDNGNLINTITIKDGKAYMSFATCLNKDCMHMGYIQSGSRKQIACLPNKVLIYLTEDNVIVDGITR